MYYFVESLKEGHILKKHMPIFTFRLTAKYRIKTGSIQTALKSLIEKDILDKNIEGYYFQDPLFEYWMRRV